MRRGFNSRYFKHSADVPVDLSEYNTVNADAPASTVSSKYGFIPTTRPVQILADHGWFPVAVNEARALKEEKQGFQKHMIRFSHASLTKEVGVGGTIPQIVLTNDHSGSAAFEFLVGLFEKVCSNQLCVCKGDVGRVRVLHRGYTDALVETSLTTIMDSLPGVLDAVDRYKGLTLTPEQSLAYAAAAIDLRWDGEQYAVKPQDLLSRRHYEQKAPTLWNTYNAVQENVIRGGIRAVNTDGRRARAKAVTSIKEDIRLNKALWTLTERMAELTA